MDDGDAVSLPWAQDAVLAWAGRRPVQEEVSDAELRHLSDICRLSVPDVCALLATKGLRLEPSEPSTWRLARTDCALPADESPSEIARLAADVPRLLSWSTDDTAARLDPGAKTAVASLAKTAFKSASLERQLDESDDLLDGVMCVAAYRMATGKDPRFLGHLSAVRHAWAAEVAKLRAYVVRRNSTSLRKSARAAATRTTSYYEAADEGALSQLAENTVAAAGNGTARKKRRANGDSTEAEMPGVVRGKLADVAELSPSALRAKILEQSDSVCIQSTTNRPDVSQLGRGRDFVPLVFSRSDSEPPHYIVEPRIIRRYGKKRLQNQGLHEYLVEGFPAPVHPELWLKQQRAKYVDWLQNAAGCESVSLENEVVQSRCMTMVPLAAGMCGGCTRRRSDCYCAFKDVRLITHLRAVLGNGEEIDRYLIAPMFCNEKVKRGHVSIVVRPAQIPEWCLSSDVSTMPPAMGEMPPGEWALFYNQFLTAQTLMHSLDMIQNVLVDDEEPVLNGVEYGVHPRLGCSAVPCVYRALAPGSRQSCDFCSTSILSAYFTCSQCMTELCPRCFYDMDDSSANTDTRVYHKTKAGTAKIDLSLRCRHMRVRDNVQVRVGMVHRRRQFLRMSQFTMEDVAQVRAKVQKFVALDRWSPRVDCMGPVDDCTLNWLHTKMARLARRARDLHVHEAWELPVMYVDADELTTREFSQLWRRGQVVVVRGLLEKLDSEIWKPDWWIRKQGYELVSVLDCAKHAAPVAGGEWPLRDFYRLFDGQDHYADMFDADMEAASDWPSHRASVEQGILKLKDWPPTDDFHNRLPEHFARFMSALPFPEYTQRNGLFNLANQLPAEFVPPDLGPKMYCAYGSSDQEGGVGTTNLHCDMADAVNIMAYASRDFLQRRNIRVPGIWEGQEDQKGQEGNVAAAVWDIYPPETVANLRKYIRQEMGKESSGDPIHDQETFLTRPHRQALFEQYGASGAGCYRVYQNPGDAVFIPAGAAHQVCNYASAVKIAMDFVSPERVEYCRALTDEFRALHPQHPRTRDLLQLSSILWWAFADKSS
ncbi:hypothetical protein GGF46_003246 [Coemansia sp. RSA 552]|nr:hypothetical protein GGF46_003246 [Coemansia sp. RSA 552]